MCCVSKSDFSYWWASLSRVSGCVARCEVCTMGMENHTQYNNFLDNVMWFTVYSWHNTPTHATLFNIRYAPLNKSRSINRTHKNNTFFQYNRARTYLYSSTKKVKKKKRMLFIMLLNSNDISLNFMIVNISNFDHSQFLTPRSYLT
jgi:hypothetical protein